MSKAGSVRGKSGIIETVKATFRKKKKPVTSEGGALDGKSHNSAARRRVAESVGVHSSQLAANIKTSHPQSEASKSINNASIPHSRDSSSLPTPTLTIKEEEFDVSKAINYLEGVQAYSKKPSQKDGAATVAGEIRTGRDENKQLVFYISQNGADKAEKKTTRKEQQRTLENKKKTATRAIKSFKTVAEKLVNDGHLEQGKLTEVFTPIEKNKSIDSQSIQQLKKLLEDGRKNANEKLVLDSKAADSSARAGGGVDIATGSVVSSGNPFDDIIESGVSTTNVTTQSTKVINNQPPRASPPSRPPLEAKTEDKTSPKSAGVSGFFSPFLKFFSSIADWISNLISAVPKKNIIVEKSGNGPTNSMPPPTTAQTNSSIATSNLSSASNQPGESASQFTDEGVNNFNAYVNNFSAYQAANIHLDPNKDYAKSASLDAAEFYLSFWSKLPDLTTADRESIKVAVTLLDQFRPNSKILKAAKLKSPTT